jgi:hypothetical protein
MSDQLRSEHEQGAKQGCLHTCSTAVLQFGSLSKLLKAFFEKATHIFKRHWKNRLRSPFLGREIYVGLHCIAEPIHHVF